jgi:Phage phiEco32-like COOH.NH2 ligase-type 2
MTMTTIGQDEKVPGIRLQMGCDPEVFIEKGGKIVPSEIALPASSLEYDGGKIVRDGIQVELNPRDSHCNNILLVSIKSLIGQLSSFGAISKKTLVEVDEETFNATTKASKSFGCKPSFDAYTKVETKRTVDPQVYRKRAGAGHIHLGYATTGDNTLRRKIKAALDDPIRTVKILDIVVGNTLVLLDRDPGSKERRETYGRAGEFRTPAYGIEYRVPSNFWLRSPVLASLVFKLSRQAVMIAAAEGVGEELMAMVNQDDIVRAINENDFDLAKANFEKVRAFLSGPRFTKFVSGFDSNGFYPLATPTGIVGFDYLVEKGIDNVFTGTIEEEWAKYEYGLGYDDWCKRLKVD